MHAAFSQWARLTLTRSAAAHLLARYLHRLLSLCFAHWAHHAFSRSAASQLLAWRLRGVQAHTFLHWRVVAAARRHRALQMQSIRDTVAAEPCTRGAAARHALRRWRVGPAAASSFDAWRSAVASQKYKLELVSLARSHMKLWHLKRTFHAWHACVQYLARNQLEGIRMEGSVCGELVDSTLQTWREVTRCAVTCARREAAADSCSRAHLTRGV